MTIAGSDSSGGAGIQADLKTFASLGCYGTSVITAVTAQNTTAVTGIHEIPAEFVKKQIETIFTDINIDAVKTGMLKNAKIIVAVAEQLQSHRNLKIVVDPVMVSKSGTKLLDDTAIETMKSKLLPLATLVTPNIPEANILTGMQIKNKSDMEKAAAIIFSLGTQAVLIKGGHLRERNCVDCLCIRKKGGNLKIHWFENKRVNTKNTHGTGCTLSSAVAAHLGKELKIENAVKQAIKYVHETIKAGNSYSLGKGQGPLHHFYKLWR